MKRPFKFKFVEHYPPSRQTVTVTARVPQAPRPRARPLRPPMIINLNHDRGSLTVLVTVTVAMAVAARARVSGWLT